MDNAKVSMFESALMERWQEGVIWVVDLEACAQMQESSEEWRMAAARCLSRIDGIEREEADADRHAEAIDEDGDPGRRGLMQEL